MSDVRGAFKMHTSDTETLGSSREKGMQSKYKHSSQLRFQLSTGKRKEMEFTAEG